MIQRIKVEDLKTGKVITLKKFNENNLIEFDKKHLSFAEIVKKKLLSKSVLERLVVAGTLKESKYRNKRYIDRTELFNFFERK